MGLPLGIAITLTFPLGLLRPLPNWSYHTSQLYYRRFLLFSPSFSPFRVPIPGQLTLLDNFKSKRKNDRRISMVDIGVSDGLEFTHLFFPSFHFLCFFHSQLL